jgi:hypothetical protein
MVAVVFMGAAAIYPYPRCPVIYQHPGGRILTPFELNSCDRSWHIPLRIEVALTGILIALVIAFIGARIDQLILRHRRSRGVGLLPTS